VGFRRGFPGDDERPEFQKNLQDAGTPDPDVVEVFEIHATIP
jgi:hypothetical protein